jgi:carboxypeptidase C (cathepsin A)
MRHALLLQTILVWSYCCAEQLPLSVLRDTTAKNGSAPYMTFAHDDLPGQAFRIKKLPQAFCGSSQGYAGYLDSGPRHLFAYFFESERNPAEDPLTLWTNGMVRPAGDRRHLILSGGPGCASEVGLFLELGPCKVSRDANSTFRNKHSWTRASNMIFLDQPVDVGFSYGTQGYTVDTTQQAAIDVHAFLVFFFQAFPALQGREFHLSGESYAGRYLPLMASWILHENEKIATSRSSLPLINLTSVLIGNGLKDGIHAATSFYEQTCTKANGLGRPILDIYGAGHPFRKEMG